MSDYKMAVEINRIVSNNTPEAIAKALIKSEADADRFIHELLSAEKIGEKALVSAERSLAREILKNAYLSAKLCCAEKDGEIALLSTEGKLVQTEVALYRIFMENTRLHDEMKSMQTRIDDIKSIVLKASNDHDGNVRPYWLVSIDEALKDGSPATPAPRFAEGECMKCGGEFGGHLVPDCDGDFYFTPSAPKCSECGDTGYISEPGGFRSECVCQDVKVATSATGATQRDSGSELNDKDKEHREKTEMVKP